MRNDVVGGRSRAALTDVEAMTLALSHIGRSLAGLKGVTNLLLAFLAESEMYNA